MRRCTVAMAPRGKGRPRVMLRGGRPHAYTDDKTVAAEELVARVYAEQVKEATIEGPCALYTHFTFPMPVSWSKKKRAALDGQHHTQKPDGDNCHKLIADALNGIAYLDDSAIVTGGYSKVWGQEGIVSITVKRE